MPGNLALVDDSAAIRRRVVQILGPTHNIVAFGSGEELLRWLEHEKRADLDLVIVDLDLGPDLETIQGLKLAERLRRRPRSPKIVFTGQADYQTVLAAARWRPDGYVVEAAPLELCDAVEKVLRGATVATPSVVETLLEIASNHARLAALGGFDRPTLTSREKQVLSFMVLHRGCGNRSLAQALHMSLNTFESHVTRIYEKVQVKNRPGARAEAIAKALRLGLVDLPASCFET